jgi:hypothetical protein
MSRRLVVVAIVTLVAGCHKHTVPLSVTASEARLVIPPEDADLNNAKYVDLLDWKWHLEKASLRYCVIRYLPDYRLNFTPDPDLEFGRGLIRILDGGKEICALEGHPNTVFTRVGDVLYFADFDARGEGCNLLAYDLSSGQRLWKSKLRTVGYLDHSAYSNQVTIDTARDGLIVVTGDEIGVGYVEVVDSQSGKTLAHRVYRNLR